MSGKLHMYRNCTLCPQSCLVDRTQGELGVCGQSSTVHVAWAGLHRGEEPPISKTAGSGTIFFCGCPLHCPYCQNIQISGKQCAVEGKSLSIKQLADLYIDLQKMGAANINIVTGTHFLPSILDALDEAKSQGLHIPIVWNSSGYETVESLHMLLPYVDIFLIDVKTLDREVAQRFCHDAHYGEIAQQAIEFLVTHIPQTTVGEDGELRGTVVRHLVFPGALHATMEVLQWFSTYAKEHCYLSLMVQFVPPTPDSTLPEISQKEYDSLIELLQELEIDEGFVQELEDNIPWIPDFSQKNPFPYPFATPLESFFAL